MLKYTWLNISARRNQVYRDNYTKFTDTAYVHMQFVFLHNCQGTLVAEKEESVT